MPLSFQNKEAQMKKKSNIIEKEKDKKKKLNKKEITNKWKKDQMKEKK